MIELIKHIVNQFAENAETVEYIVVEEEQVVNVTILLTESDMGKVIGRQGKIAKAMRTIIKSATHRGDKKYNIEIKGKEEA